MNVDSGKREYSSERKHHKQVLSNDSLINWIVSKIILLRVQRVIACGHGRTRITAIQIFLDDGIQQLRKNHSLNILRKGAATYTHA